MPRFLHQYCSTYLPLLVLTGQLTYNLYVIFIHA